MTFLIGKTYRDTIGRKWKIIKWKIVGDGYTVFLVRHRFKTEIAVQDSTDKATILLDYGFTTIWGFR